MTSKAAVVEFEESGSHSLFFLIVLLRIQANLEALTIKLEVSFGVYSDIDSIRQMRVARCKRRDLRRMYITFGAWGTSLRMEDSFLSWVMTEPPRLVQNQNSLQIVPNQL
ncbi:hypothetical protein PIB30_083251 [Stylosanthes scabra]|uniref:Uncharacterized protein n=1 Tax=Stylosanthes scabra TaxID=79078 RepID=A0ABU6QSF3_9FABA|nr:hypothetical protein [Stylosanthes scabra]